jgi:nicotinamidase-related amidase
MVRRALLIIDMQRDLCLDERRRDKVRSMLPSLHAAIDRFATAGQALIYTCFALPPDDPQFERFGDRYCIEGSEGAEIIPDLLPAKGPIIVKRKHSAFFETDLDRLLRADGVEEVFLTGLQTHICIMTTAADASFRGYRTVAIRDCVLSSSDDNNDRALDWIAAYVGEVLPLAAVLTELERG